jgi:hypothetical protein
VEVAERFISNHYTGGSNIVGDPLTTCLSFVNPANITHLVSGCGRTRDYHFLNEDLYALSRVAWFNSIEYTDAELRAASSLTSGKNEFLSGPISNSIFNNIFG